MEGKSHEKACAQFIDLLAEVIRSDIKNILSSVRFFFYIAMGGSQPWKTGTEKEFLNSKVVMQGQCVELLLEYIHMDNYGGDAKGLKHAVDNVLLKQYNILENIFKTLMVYCCASTLKFS